jgi:hypothetical protein
MNFKSQTGKFVHTLFWLNVAPKKMEFEDLGIVKGWPIAEYVNQLFTARD